MFGRCLYAFGSIKLPLFLGPTLMTKAARYLEKSVKIQRSAWHHIPEHNHIKNEKAVILETRH